VTKAEESFHTCRIQGRLISNLGTSEKYKTLPETLIVGYLLGSRSNNLMIIGA